MNTLFANGLPSLRQELNRKAFETIEWLFDSVHAGKISAAQFSTGIDALWMAVSGLTDEKIADLITAADGEANKAEKVVKQMFVKGNHIVVATWAIGDDKVAVTGYTNGVAGAPREKKYLSSKEASTDFNKFAAGLAGKGYTPL